MDITTWRQACSNHAKKLLQIWSSVILMLSVIGRLAFITFIICVEIAFFCAQIVIFTSCIFTRVPLPENNNVLYCFNFSILVNDHKLYE